MLRFGAWFMMPLMLSFMSGCATTPPASSLTSIGPYTHFSGRLLVIEPSRRWQVMIDWKAGNDQGRSRLTHAASHRIIELKWSADALQIRDNQASSTHWQPISIAQLSKHGMILPPQILAQILSGDMPTAFKVKDSQTWQGHVNGRFIRIHWVAKSQRLTITDIAHGRQAILIIHE